MRIDIKVPPKGYSLIEFTVVAMVDEGTWVEFGDAVASIESDKAVHEVTAEHAGRVVQVHTKVGLILSVGDKIATIDSELRGRSDFKKNCEDNGGSSSFVVPSPGNVRTNIGWIIDSVGSEIPYSIYEIWFANQGLASRQTGVENTSELRNQFETMIKTGTAKPFAVFVAKDKESADISGWVGCFPTKNNPLSRTRVAEVSLYVKEPFSPQNPAVLLMEKILDHGRSHHFGFYIGMCSPSNEAVKKLMNSCRYKLLGEAGKSLTQIWVFDF
jgi:pyruvate/2-oxoglutarate dehydrogenase complex dihydrolipoamide acyltransferase (E2) component